MTPRLVLLTGPAAEVADYLEDEESFEVRDYWEAPRCIAGVPDAVAIEHGIREFAGGEAWLVGLVLPAVPRRMMLQDVAITSKPNFEREGFRRDCGLPARLAILAPEPPPLLVERVRAWGGEVWWCSVDEHEGPWARIDPTPARVARDCLAAARTWPEAVRAALGEVAP